MLSPSAIALTGFIAWALFLLVLMEFLRARLVVLGRIPGNEFKPDNSNLSPFMQRLARAHVNCVEGFPIFGGLLVVAIITGNTAITDPLAYAFLAARLFQSFAHLASLSVLAVNLRFAGFALQIAIAIWWTLRLLLLAG